MDALTKKIEAFLNISSGDGSGYGYGDGSGDGCGYGYGYGYGSGYGDGYGSGDGDGDGYGDGDGLTEFEGSKVYNIDGVYTCITNVHGNLATGFTIKYNSVKKPCYIVKVDDCFAHGETAEEAFRDAQAKAFKNMPIGERIKQVIAKYPDIDKKIANTELFVLHNMLTGSCEFGRRQFAEQHGIDVEYGAMTMREFCQLTKNAYGSQAIRDLALSYGIEL